VDRPAAAKLWTSAAVSVRALIVSELEDENCEKLDGIPMTREQYATWLKFSANLDPGFNRR
jgi:hypothetical protein